MTASILQYVIYLILLVGLGYPLGIYMGKVMNGEKTFMSKVLVPCENGIYKMMRVKVDEEMHWKKYMFSAFAFSAVCLVFLWGIQMIQAYLPFNPEGQKNVSWYLAYNTSASFTSNTNWQAYNAENTLSYFSQSMGLLVQNYVSAAAGVAVMFAMIRAFKRFESNGLGSFWVDMVRIHLYIFIPLCIFGGIVIGTQGVAQTLRGSDKVTLLEPIAIVNTVNADGELEMYQIDADADAQNGIITLKDSIEVNGITLTAGTVINLVNDTVTDSGGALIPDLRIAGDMAIVDEQLVPLGPAAGHIAMKQLGTNGGGFYGLNSTHPLENSTIISNLVQMLFLLLIPVGLCFTFGRNIGNKKQGFAIFMAMFIMLIGFQTVAAVNEHTGTPQLAQNGAVDLSADSYAGGHAGGNMEGKETRHGIATSVTWAVWTTAASNGSVNSMHDSYTPMGGFVPMLLMQLGEVVFGGVGCGLYGMLSFAIMTVFIAGLMVGRTPEFLGKKIEPYEMKWACLVCLATPIGILVGTGFAALFPLTHESLNNPGAHGFSELLYAYTSGGGNNGSAFAGFNSNTPYIAVTHGTVMLFVRFLPMGATLAISGSLVQKKQIATTAGTLSTTNAMFVFLLIVVVLLIGALSFIPALALGPIAEHFSRVVW